MSTAADREQIDEVLAQFVDAFMPGPDVGQRLARLRNLMLPRAVIVRTCGATPLAMTVEEFIAPRLEQLTGGTLADFHEWQVEGRTDVHGDIASYLAPTPRRASRRRSPSPAAG